jgi:hypothetical protein
MSADYAKTPQRSPEITDENIVSFDIRCDISHDQELKEQYDDLAKLIYSIKKSVIDSHKSDDYLKRVLVFCNKQVRENATESTDIEIVENFRAFLDEYFNQEISARKTDAGKASVQLRKENTMQIFRDNSVREISKLFRAHRKMEKLKEQVISLIRTKETIDVYLKRNDGIYIPTTHEGFVISGIEGTVYKLVKRSTFSYANFSDLYEKGWN